MLRAVTICWKCALFFISSYCYKNIQVFSLDFIDYRCNPLVVDYSCNQKIYSTIYYRYVLVRGFMEQQMTDISKAEFEVLEVLWQAYPAAASDIVSRLNEKKTWHEKTVKTLLNRLVKKQAVSFTKEQRRYLYSPLFAREDYTTEASQSLIERLFSGKVSPLVAGFAKNKSLQKEDVEALKSLIDQWENEHD